CQKISPFIFVPYEPIVHGTFGVDQSEPWDILIKQIKDLIAEIMVGSRGFGYSDYNGLYIEPYEPIAHRTFGVDQSDWNIIVLRIKDIFAEIMAGSRGIGHPDYDG
ncbi:22542_t:CDS:2, partial [Racocetra persica]